jgi:DNA-binding response OmpR family regulator
MSEVILVEDDPDTEALVMRALRQHLYARILIARDGQEAVSLLESLTAPPSLVLLDLKLPKLDGFEVLARTRAMPHTKVVPIVVFSSDDSLESQERALQLGATEYAIKPITFDRLRNTIRQLVDRYLSEPRPPLAATP